MNRINKIIAITAFSLLVLALPSVASAQWRDRDDDYYGNGGYGNGSYNRNIRGTLQNLKNRANNFEKITNRIEDRNDDRWGNRNGRYGGGYNGGIDRIEDLADRFRKATNDLLDDYGNGRNLNNSRDEARRVLDLGGQIDQMIYSTRGNRQLQNEWNMIRRDLNVVSQVYGYNYNNGGQYNRNRGNNRNGDWRNRIPFPLPF